MSRLCKQCGKEIINGINGAQISGYCTDCKPIVYHSSPTPARTEVDWDALDYAEGRCLDDNWD